jgi:uncharacterized membrane protein
MGPVEQSVEIAAPLELVYDAFTRFEDLPEFIEGVEDVRIADETHVRWRMRIDGDVRDAGAEIVQQLPGERIMWHAVSGKALDGSITFERLDDEHTRVTVRLGDHHQGPAPVDKSRVRRDLDRFKAVTEARSRSVP